MVDVTQTAAQVAGSPTTVRQESLTPEKNDADSLMAFIIEVYPYVQTPAMVGGCISTVLALYHYPLPTLAALLGLALSDYKVSSWASAKIPDSQWLDLNSRLTPQQLLAVRKCLIDNPERYAVIAEEGTSRVVMVEASPESQTFESKLQKLKVLHVASFQMPQERVFAKARKELADQLLTEQPSDPSALQARRVASLFLGISKRLWSTPLSEMSSESKQAWNDISRFLEVNELTLYRGHKLKCDENNAPVLVMPNGTQQSWAKLKEEGLNPNDDYRMPDGWSYTKDGFVNSQKS